ncbi:MAG: MerR family DNA-binding protein [Planctomycetia bacterium]|nr:MerR family DNA-binding protein [Planctomycetia bacterium]
MGSLTTGALAKQAGLGIETVRYYERRGLLPVPARRSSGYRAYPEDAVLRLRFIKRSQELGFTLKEVKELLALWEDPETDRSIVRSKATAKAADIERRIRDLTVVRAKLLELSANCKGKGSTKQCPIMQALSS